MFQYYLTYFLPGAALVQTIILGIQFLVVIK